MSRPVVASLNGSWDLVFDPENSGLSKGWPQAFPSADAEPVPVPGVIEQVRPGYDGVAWYRTRFRAPAPVEHGRILLRFGAVAYYCECWLNAAALGAHEGGFSRFEFDLTGQLHEGENELVVRVVNPPSDREVDGFRAGAPLNQSNIPVSKAAWYFSFGGIWQDVDLIAVGPVRVEHCFVKPDPHTGTIACEFSLLNTVAESPGELRLRVHPAKDPDKTAASGQFPLTLAPGANALERSLSIEAPRLWSPEDPFLYTLVVEILQEGRVIHHHEERFGLREFTIEDGRFVLNGEPIILKGFLQQGMYPRSLITPHERAMAVKELRLLKDHGFNFLRAHLRPPEPWYLDLADEMGILIEGEPAIGWITNSPETEERCLREIESMLLRDRNHPSIVFWCLLNEAYHFLGFTMEQVRALTDRLARNARRLDPTRLMMDTSGGAGSGTEAGTSVMLPNSETTATMIDAHAYCPIPPRDRDLEAYRCDGKDGMVLFISEFGAPEAPPDFPSVLARYTPAERGLGLEDYRLHQDFYDSLRAAFDEGRLDRCFASVDQLIERANTLRADDIRLITLAQRSNPKLAGTVFCQLADASGEMFGATDVWREKKPVFDGFAQACQSPLLAPEASPRLIVQGESIRLRAVLLNEKFRGGKRVARLTLVDAGNQPLETLFEGGVDATESIQTVFETTLRGDWPVGEYRLVARLDDGGDSAPREQSVSLRVLPPPSPRARRIAVFERKGEIAAASADGGIAVDLFTNNYRDKSVPVFLDLREIPENRAQRAEILGQVRKLVEVGGTAVLFRPEPLLLYEHLLPYLIRPEGMMRTLAYVADHPLTEGLPTNDIAGFEYAEVLDTRADKAADIVAAGGEIVIGALWSHMWTRPADYRHGALLYSLPIGRGRVFICNLDLFAAFERSPVARQLFLNLANHAASVIRPGGEQFLLSRCIDPLPEGALESLP